MWSVSVHKSSIHSCMKNACWVVTMPHSHSVKIDLNCIVVIPGFTQASSCLKSSLWVFLPWLLLRCKGARCLVIEIPLLDPGAEISVKPILLLCDILSCTLYSQYLPARAYVLFNSLNGPDPAALRTWLWYLGQYTTLGGIGSSKAVNVIQVRFVNYHFDF